MKTKWTLFKCSLFLCLCMLLSPFLTIHADAEEREPYFRSWYDGLITQTNQSLTHITIHEGETLLLTYAYIDTDEGIVEAKDISSSRSSYYDWTITTDTSLDMNLLDYKNEHISVWMPTMDSAQSVYIKGKTPTDNSDTYYLTLYQISEYFTGPRIYLSVPITVLPAEEGANYGDYGAEKPSDLYMDLDSLFSAMRQPLLNHESAEYTYFLPVSLAASIVDPNYLVYDQYVLVHNHMYDFYSDQMNIPANEGDYLLHSFYGSFSTSMNKGASNYQGEELIALTFDTTGTIYNTTLEQEKAFETKLASLFASGGALEYTKGLQKHAQIRACIDYIQSNVSYIGTTEAIYHSAYSALCNGTATCEGYALLFYRMLRELGIANRVLMNNDVGAHTYNLVLLDGQYYYCDANTNIYLKGSDSMENTQLQDYFLTDNFRQNVLSKVSAADYDPAAQQTAAVRSFVERMYTVALSRPAEPDGLKYWSDRLLALDTTGADVSNGFIMSEEFFNKNYTNTDYIKVLYRTFFNREADEGGLNYWLQTLSDRYSRKYVLAGFVNSPEFDDLCSDYGITRGTLISTVNIIPEGIYDFVKRSYQYSLGREGDEAGIEFWVQRIVENLTKPTDVAKAFFLSPEYVSKATSDEEYIKALYKTFMNRDADASGLDYWVGQLESGITREAAMDSFAACQEFIDILASYGL